MYIFFLTSLLLRCFTQLRSIREKSMKKKGMKNWFRLCRRLSSVRERSLLVKDIFSVFFSINSFSSMLFVIFFSCVLLFRCSSAWWWWLFFVSSPPLLLYVAMMTTTTWRKVDSRIYPTLLAMIMTMMMAIEFELMWKFLHSQHYWLTGFALFFIFYFNWLLFCLLFLLFCAIHSLTRLYVYIFFFFFYPHMRGLYTKKNKTLSRCILAPET